MPPTLLCYPPISLPECHCPSRITVLALTLVLYMLMSVKNEKTVETKKTTCQSRAHCASTRSWVRERVSMVAHAYTHSTEEVGEANPRLDGQRAKLNQQIPDQRQPLIQEGWTVS